MGILQAVAVGWIHCFEDALATGSKASVYILTIGYWALLVPLAWLAYFAFPLESWVAIPVFWGWFACITLTSMLVAKFAHQVDFKTWYQEIFFSGVRPVSVHMCGLAKPAMKPIAKLIFEFWFCFCIKFIFPWAIWWLLIMTIKKDIDVPYEGYHVFWQILGGILPVLGILLFLGPAIFAKGASDGSFKSAFAIQKEPSVNEVQPDLKNEIEAEAEGTEMIEGSVVKQ